MKNLIALAIGTILLSSCAHRLGDLTLLSNRNYDRSQNYTCLKRDVYVKMKTKKNDVLERAVDKATSSVEGGEFLMNVSIWVSPSGKKLKLRGDVYGIAPTAPPTPAPTPDNK